MPIPSLDPPHRELLARLREEPLFRQILQRCWGACRRPLEFRPNTKAENDDQIDTWKYQSGVTDGVRMVLRAIGGDDILKENVTDDD